MGREEVFEAMARVMYVCPGIGMGVAFHTDTPTNQFAVPDRRLAAAAKNQL